MKIFLHLIVLIAMLGMAALQLNDPDPLLWVTLYVCIAALVGARLMQQKHTTLFIAVSGIAIACLLISFPGFLDYLNSGDFTSLTGDMAPSRPYVETAREFLGTSIGAICLACYRRWHCTAEQNT